MANESLITDPTYVYGQYDQGGAPDPNIPIIAGGTAVTTINAGVGPIITINGGTTGLTFSSGSSTISLSGILVAANGGTGNSSYAKGDLLAASAGTTLTKLGVGANNSRLAADSTQTTGLAWIAASTGWDLPSGGELRDTFDTATITLERLAEHVAALIVDLNAQKIISS